MGLSNRFPCSIIQAVTESIVTDGLVVVVGSVNNKVMLPSGADPTTGVVGVVYRPDGSSAAVGDVIDIVTSGVYPCVASTTITRGAKMAIAGTSGKVKDGAVGGGTNTMIIGVALEDATTDLDRVACTIAPSVYQG